MSDIDLKKGSSTLKNVGNPLFRKPKSTLHFLMFCLNGTKTKQNRTDQSHSSSPFPFL